jgi:hypothetical protein
MSRYSIQAIFMFLIIGIFCLLAAAFLYGTGDLTNKVAIGCAALGILALFAFFYMLMSGGE